MSATQLLFDEVTARFPEVLAQIYTGDEDRPYEMMRHVADWVTSLPPEELSSEIIQRVRAFSEWCEHQPRTETAKDDLLTIVAVGLWEELMKSDSARRLIPHLMDRSSLELGADYLKGWVGEENYRKALSEYDRHV